MGERPWIGLAAVLLSGALLTACDDDGSDSTYDATVSADSTENTGDATVTTGDTSGSTDASATSGEDGSGTAADGDAMGTTADTGPDPDTATGPPNGSAGCGNASSEATDAWLERSLDIGGSARTFYVRLPAGYDENRAYPIVYQWHGCSSNAERQNNNVPVHDASGADAILVRGRAADNCWSNAEDGPDIPYIDAVLPAAEAEFCADTDRRFATGYSSGAFMTHRLACIRGDQFAGVASIAGGQGGNDCQGPVPALLIHDAGDPTVNISASVSARDAHLARNGCDVSAGTSDWTHAPCVQYDGCPADLPVVWCETTGEGHGRQDGLAAPAFWDFLSGL